MTEEQTPSLRRTLARAFSPPLTPTFVAAFAALKVSFPGACPGKDGSLVYDGKTTEFAPLILFSPREPLFLLTGDNALLLTAFALAFSPVSPLSVAAFAALKVSFPGACPGKDGSLF